MTGHLLGGAGALEAVATILALHHRGRRRRRSTSTTSTRRSSSTSPTKRARPAARRHRRAQQLVRLRWRATSRVAFGVPSARSALVAPAARLPPGRGSPTRWAGQSAGCHNYDRTGRPHRARHRHQVSYPADGLRRPQPVRHSSRYDATACEGAAVPRTLGLRPPGAASAPARPGVPERLQLVVPRLAEQLVDLVLERGLAERGPDDGGLEPVLGDHDVAVDAGHGVEDAEVGRGGEARALGRRRSAPRSPRTAGGASRAARRRSAAADPASPVQENSAAVGARLRRLGRPVGLTGDAEHAAHGPLDVRAQRGRRGVDVEHAPGCTVARGHHGVSSICLSSGARYAFPSGLVGGQIDPSSIE